MERMCWKWYFCIIYCLYLYVTVIQTLQLPVLFYVTDSHYSDLFFCCCMSDYIAIICNQTVKVLNEESKRKLTLDNDFGQNV